MAKTVSKASAFFSAAKPKQVDFDLLGVGKVQICELKESEVTQIREFLANKPDDLRARLFVLMLVVRSTYLDGERVFSDEDVDGFSEIGNSAHDELLSAAMRINGYGAQKN